MILSVSSVISCSCFLLLRTTDYELLTGLPYLLFLRHDVKRKLQGGVLTAGFDSQDALPLDIAGDAVLVQSDGERKGLLHVLPFFGLGFATDLEITQAGQGGQGPRRPRVISELQPRLTQPEDVVHAVRAADLHVELSGLGQ